MGNEKIFSNQWTFKGDDDSRLNIGINYKRGYNNGLSYIYHVAIERCECTNGEYYDYVCKRLTREFIEGLTLDQQIKVFSYWKSYGLGLGLSLAIILLAL
ncbi:MAG: hypothetical protein LBF08_06770 [Dysgonamonadaceae bacterium]|nr:hypothetical protein [Dysgonamonadaceae bacterium]